jgi:hypothetical protein
MIAVILIDRIGYLLLNDGVFLGDSALDRRGGLLLEERKKGLEESLDPRGEGGEDGGKNRHGENDECRMMNDEWNEKMIPFH